jgi:hypothetical protein
MLLAGRSRVRDPTRLMNSFNLPNPSGHTRPGIYSASNRRSRKIMFLGNRARSVRDADNLTAICEPIT